MIFLAVLLINYFMDSPHSSILLHPGSLSGLCYFRLNISFFFPDVFVIVLPNAYVQVLPVCLVANAFFLSSLLFRS